MKYFGEKSLSSFLSVFFRAAWYIVLAAAILAFLSIAFLTFFAPQFENFIIDKMGGSENDFSDKDWQDFKNFPMKAKIILAPFAAVYFAVIVILILKVITNSRLLFSNFRKNIIFDKNNVVLLNKIAKLLIPFSIMTFDFSTLLVTVILFMICEIFKNGSQLQEEHDLTI